MLPIFRADGGGPGRQFGQTVAQLVECASFFRRIRIAMELNQLKRQLKDLGERISSLRGFL
jgi:hypothetical protein